MSNKKPSWVRWSVNSFIAFSLLLGSYLFLNSEKGLEIAVQLGKSFLPGNLTIAEIHGSLLGPIQIKELRYTNTDTQLSISLAQFDWHWSSLLQGQLNLSPLRINQLKLFIKENKQKKIESKQKAIPFGKIIKHLKFDSVDIQQINIRTSTIDFILQGSLHQQWQLNWQLNIAKIADFIPNLQGKLALQGKISGAQHYPEFYLISQKTDLKWQNWQLKQIQTVLDIDMAKNKKWLFDVKIARLNNKTLILTPLQLKLSGYLAPFFLQGSLSDFKLYRIAEPTSTASASIPRTQINSHLSTYGLETTLLTKQENKNQLWVHLLLPGYQATSIFITPKQIINGQIHLTLKDLNLLSKFIPDLKNSQGILDAQVNFAGPLSLPKINLRLNLQQASAKIPRLGLNLTHINIQLHTDKNTLIGIGNLTSGKGSLSLDTKTQLTPENFTTLIDLQGKNISVINTPEYKITASPQLKIEANTQQIKTQGLIIVPKANIKINIRNSNLIGLTEDIEFVGDKKKSASFPFTFKNDIKIECGDNIQFQYQGLKTKLIGSLAIRQDPDHPILATGQLKLYQGEYNYYGQSLKLQPNSLLDFANTPIDDPKLNITASRKIWILPKLSAPSTSTRVESKLGAANFIQSALQDSQPVPIQLDIGLHLRGSLQSPHIDLFTNPSNIIKSQLDMLSYLITGQASSQLSIASTQLLLHSVTNLNGVKNINISQFINKAQKKMGLDQLTIGAKPIFDPTSNSLQQNTSLIIEKNLSPKLNISYSLGLLNAINILEINYFLNKNFSLQSTNSNFSNGIDLLYRLEKY